MIDRLIAGWPTPACVGVGDLRALADAVASGPGGLIVEIGTYHGLTAAFLGRVVELLDLGVPVVSIDPFEDAVIDPEGGVNAAGSYGLYRNNVARHPSCVPVVTTSERAAPIIPSNIAVLFVDGQHTYAGCKLDLDLYGPKVLPRGHVLVHDYSMENYPGVVRAVDEFQAQYHWRVVALPDVGEPVCRGSIVLQQT